MKKIILLTGAAGFIGSNLLQYLFEKYPEYHLVVLDSLTYAGNQKNISQKIRESGRFEFWYGDVTNPYIVNDLMERANMVVHLAAETHVARSIFDNTKFFHTDVIGTQTLMNALIKFKHIERFIHISTSEVYGTAIGNIISEDHPLNPMSPYAGAKAGADRLVYSYWSCYDVPAVILRPFNNYGPRQHLEKMTPRFITSALKNEPLTVHGDGTAKRDWIFVEDHCEAIDKALHIKDFGKIKNQIINIGTGKAVSVLDIARLVLKELNRSKDLLDYIGNRPGQVQLHCATTEKAKKLLDWQARTSVEEGLRKTIQWYRDNPDWWQELEWMKHVPIHTANGKIEMH
ncbi:MAG TPA: GDP-mannose 4,6-dehydratase [Candidatus Omnitrophota bacterium]|nr:GDP-mannose 4,6-dehydratase [Candidatus Omnitrophota bacterium]